MALTIIILLHLIPGLAYTGFLLWLTRITHSRKLPVAFADALATPLILVGGFFLVFHFYGVSIGDILARQESITPGILVFYSAVSLAWAVTVFKLTSRWGEAIYKRYFSWFPERMSLDDHISNKARYSHKLVVSAWMVSAIVNSIVAPVAEEIYFRGFLLPELSVGILLAVLINTFFFAAYHFWSPWQIPTRFIALLPMVYFVAITGNIYIAIAVHLALNLVGDTIATAPIVFKKSE